MSDSDEVQLSIVIPAYNEESRIGPTLEAAAEYLRSAPWSSEVLGVDDGSRDRTAEVVRGRIDSFPVPLTLLAEPHRGKGGAVRTGMLHARGEHRLLFDADMAMPFEELPRFMEAAREVDVVLGSREVKGARRESESALRHLRGRVFNLFVKLAAVPGIEDTQCGYKLFRASAARTIFEKVTIDGFAFDVEALVIARRHGQSLREIPIQWRHHAVSRVRPVRDTLAMIWQVLNIRWNDLRGRYRLQALE